jgi:TRAP-type C4-dicarboxylate transport system permease small subunit
MQALAQYARRLDQWLQNMVGYVVIFFGAVMVLVTLLGIFARIFTHSPPFWTEELGRDTMIYSGCLAIGIALPRGLHVGITFFLKKMPVAARVFCDILCRVLMTIFLLVMIVKGIEVCGIVSMQESPTMGFNMAWLFAITPITCALQLLFLTLMTIEDISKGFVDTNITLRAHDAEFD